MGGSIKSQLSTVLSKLALLTHTKSTARDLLDNLGQLLGSIYGLSAD
jgi:hypothetical protein